MYKKHGLTYPKYTIHGNSQRLSTGSLSTLCRNILYGTFALLRTDTVA